MRAWMAASVLAVAIGSLASCTRAPATVTEVEASKPESVLIRLERGGNSPSNYTVEVHGDGKVVFTGVAGVAIPGRHIAFVPKEQVVRLAQSFDEAKFSSLSDRYSVEVTDQPIVEISIAAGKINKSIIDEVGIRAGMPKAALALELAIDQVAGTARWIRGNEETIPSLIAENWNFKSPESGNMLAEAAMVGSFDLVRSLLAYGVDLNSPSKYSAFKTVGAQAVNRAAPRRDNRILIALLDAGAGDPHTLDYALVQAAQFGNVDNMGLLIGRGANPNAQIKTFGSPLIAATHSGQPGAVSEMLKYHPEVDARDASGNTALMHVSAYYYVGRDPGPVLVEMLVKAGARVNARDMKGNTALHKATSASVVKTLLRLGANPDLSNAAGCPPILVTYSNEVVQALVDGGANTALQSYVKCPVVIQGRRDFLASLPAKRSRRS